MIRPLAPRPQPNIPLPLSAEALSDLGARVANLMDSELVQGLATLATFDPEHVVTSTLRDAVATISDQLADLGGRSEWMLKESIRVNVLSRILRGGRDGLARVRERAGRPRDTALQRMFDTVIFQRHVDLLRISEDELVAALHVGRWCAAAGSLARMPDLAAPLEREKIEGRLAVMETLRPLQEITQGGVVGRSNELNRLHGYVAGARRPLTLVDRPPLLVYGIGGVGKSTLVAQFLLELSEQADPIAWAYLDLDRPSLSSYDPMILLADVARQVGAQFPGIRRYLDYSDRLGWEQQKGSGLEAMGSESWRTVVPQLANAVNNACGGRLVVVVDTYEELQRAELAGARSNVGELLFRMFSQLSDYALGFRLVISGRAPAYTFLSNKQSDQRLHVRAFEANAATAVLQHLYACELGRLPAGARWPGNRQLAPALADKVVATVGGSPLTLSLAARVLAVDGPEGMDDASAQARAVGRVANEFVKGFLYHRVLGHIRGVHLKDRDALTAVARASLALRYVTVDVLRDVILPAIGQPDLDASSILNGLLAETALTDTEVGPARLRDELRSPALLALRHVDPDLVSDIHRRAGWYYENHPELPDAAVEVAYHRLSAGGPDSYLGLDPIAVASLENYIWDLPPASRDLVTKIVNSPFVLSEELRVRAREREIEANAQRALDVGDFDRAAKVLQGGATWSSTTRLHRLVAQLEEARGNGEASLSANRRDMASALFAEEPQRYCACAIRLALALEQRADRQGAVAILSEADEQLWLTAKVLLRLELQLNRLAILERSGADPWPVDQWLLELDARALLHQADASSVRATSALVRLLAATLGRDEPPLVMEAVRSVGFGITTYSTHLRNLARALAVWDADRVVPGLIARRVGLHPLEATVEGLMEVWFQSLAGQGTSDTVPLLDRALSIEPPSTAIIDALRMIYLWWDIDPQLEIEESHADHFLDGPLDLKDVNAQRILRAMNGAYPARTDLQVLAAQIGLDVASLDVRTTRGLSTRNLLDQAAEVHKIPALMQQVLGDSKTASFHAEFRDAIGPEWLNQHGIRPSESD